MLGKHITRERVESVAWGAFSAFAALRAYCPPVCPPRSVEFRDFLKTALDKNPETRPSAAQLLEVSGSSLLGHCQPPLPCPALPLEVEGGGGRLGPGSWTHSSSSSGDCERPSIHQPAFPGSFRDDGSCAGRAGVKEAPWSPVLTEFTFRWGD